MPLDIYAGPLCRFYALDWENIAERYALKNGYPYKNLHKFAEAPDEDSNRDDIFDRVNLWKAQIVKQLATDHQHLMTKLKALFDDEDTIGWEESYDLDYATNRPNWDCWGSLQLWTAYATTPERTAPPHCLRNWTYDPVWQECLDHATEEPYYQYRHILSNIHCWLPLDFPTVLSSTLPNHLEANFGSIPRLAKQLKTLNDQTWQAEPAEIAQWLKINFGQDDLSAKAQYAYGILYNLVDYALTHRVPIILDY